MAEKDENEKSARFLGTLIGTILVSLMASGALSSVVNWGTAEKAASGAAEAVSDTARSHAVKVEMAMAEYIKREIEPKVVSAFEAVDEDIDRLDVEVTRCRTDLREVTILAEAALRLAERSVGRQAVEQALAVVEKDEPAAGSGVKVSTPPPSPTAAKGDAVRRGKSPAPMFEAYQQRLANEPPPPATAVME